MTQETRLDLAYRYWRTKSPSPHSPAVVVLLPNPELTSAQRASYPETLQRFPARAHATQLLTTSLQSTPARAETDVSQTVTLVSILLLLCASNARHLLLDPVGGAGCTPSLNKISQAGGEQDQLLDPVGGTGCTPSLNISPRDRPTSFLPSAELLNPRHFTSSSRRPRPSQVRDQLLDPVGGAGCTPFPNISAPSATPLSQELQLRQHCTVVRPRTRRSPRQHIL
jgi:hypothetical protein